MPGHPDPEIREGRFPKNFFLTLPQFGLKIRGRAPLQDIKSKDIQLLDFNKICLECLYMLVVNLLFAKRLVG